ncbi:MAG TPA: hypothetical protein VK211_10150 [Kamptonema sp.]|nr:hypothetical protein [Kamptonema sp.]
MRHKSFLLGFGCCLLLFLTVLCILIERGQGERGSGRREIENLFTQNQQLFAYEGQAETKGDRKPEKGNGRKD